MKIVKVTHYEGADPEETSEFVWKEGTVEELLPVFKRLVNYILPVFEGLSLIAQGFDEEVPFGTFANELSKYAYWVRVEIRK